MTVWHRGGGNRRHYRIIDFKREKVGIAAQVKSIEYDPNRSARIAVLKYRDGERRYIIAPLGLKVGDDVVSGTGVEIKTGNALPLSEIPLGTFIHNIELQPGAGAKFARSAGLSAQLIAKAEGYCHVKLSSGEVRLIPSRCAATVGQSAIPSTRTSPMARPGEYGGSARGPMSAVSP